MTKLKIAALQYNTTEKELDNAEARHQCLKSAALSPLNNKLFKHYYYRHILSLKGEAKLKRGINHRKAGS